jgi:hypothetical protein
MQRAGTAISSAGEIAAQIGPALGRHRLRAQHRAIERVSNRGEVEGDRLAYGAPEPDQMAAPEGRQPIAAGHHRHAPAARGTSAIFLLRLGNADRDNTLSIASTGPAMAIRDPESCICPTCKRVMRLSRVRALRALETTEFYLRCDTCDYTSRQLTGIATGEFACDIHQGADRKLKPSDQIAWWEREGATLVRASGTKSTDRPLRTTRLLPIGSAGSGDDYFPMGALSKADGPVLTSNVPQHYASVVVATLLVAGTIALSLASHFASSPSVVSFFSTPAPAPSEAKGVIMSSWRKAEEPSINSTATTTGSAIEPKAPARRFEKIVHPDSDSTDTEIVVDGGDRTATNTRSAVDQSSRFNSLALHRDVDSALDGEAQGSEFSVGGDRAVTRPLSARTANTSVASGAPVNRAGFILDGSDIRYLSLAELEPLSREELRIARSEILARKGRNYSRLCDVVTRV